MSTVQTPLESSELGTESLEGSPSSSSSPEGMVDGVALELLKQVKDLKLEGMRVMLTGGAGFIGSHTAVVLLEAGCEISVVDNLTNSSQEAIERVQNITQKEIGFTALDIRDTENLTRALKDSRSEAVIHFAGLKAVGESVREPFKYYDNNVNGTLSLIKAMEAAEVSNMLFSSSATIYGDKAIPPYSETDPSDIDGIPHAYGKTKLMIEHILRDQFASHPDWNITVLRYFNPIGAHPSGLIGEDPDGIPNNLMPYITQVAVGALDGLTVFGNDYDTTDGTPERDYIHVVDLSEGHAFALDQQRNAEMPDLRIYNLGSGEPSTVLEVIDAVEKASEKKIHYDIGPRRPGDLASTYAVADKARVELGWETKKSLTDMANDSWNWQLKNPKGYKS